MFFLEPNEAPNPLSPHGLIESYPGRRSTHNTFLRTGRCPSVLRPIKPETESEISGEDGILPVPMAETLLSSLSRNTVALNRG
jgi:hypothetical protein